MDTASGIGNLVAFIAGTVSFLSPCVLPLVPAYVSYIAGESIVEKSDRRRHARFSALVLSGSFVVGFSLVFVALGASATAVGRLLLEYKEQANVVAGMVIIFFGVLMLGAARWLTFLQRDLRFQVDHISGNPGSAFVLGLAFAFGWTPCIGPVLGGILTVSAAQDDISTGVQLLAAYSLGLGAPFIVAALFLRQLVGHIKRLRTIGRYLQFTAGIVMVALGIAMVTGQVTALSFWLLRILPALGAIG
jgi:cytochrome c-type biogenesis protein